MLVNLHPSAIWNKRGGKILAITVAVISAFSASVALSNELGYPGSALAEFQRFEPMLVTEKARTQVVAPRQQSSFAESAQPPQESPAPETSTKGDEKTIKYTGKCYARLDGRVRINGPCPVTWRTGDDLRVDLLAGDDENVAIARDGRKWRAHWGQLTDGAGASTGRGRSHAAHQDLGEVRKRGSCWSNSRVRICERES
jgi:hypothetical protein